MTQDNLAKRLSRLEQQMNSVRKQLLKSKGNKVDKTWRDYIGMFKDDPVFQDVVQYGARWRNSYRPKPVSKKRKK